MRTVSKYLIILFCTVFLCSFTVLASDNTESEPSEIDSDISWEQLMEESERRQQEHEEYVNEIDQKAQDDPSFSFADQFCIDNGIESYRELEQILEIYYDAMNIGFESYFDMEEASIAEDIIENELGTETVNKLLKLQEEYGYGCIDEILRAVDEIGYGELTGDYSYIKFSDIKSSDTTATHSTETTKNTDVDEVSDKISDSPLWFLLIPTLMIFLLVISRM